MQTIRHSEERGKANFGWLDSRHSFSFGHYHDPAHMGFGPLRVINEDKVQPGGGFDTHGHRDMEIISYVLRGALRHEDNMGNGSVIRPGDLQRMSAGTGVLHSEYNASAEEDVHFLQIWILPDRQDLPPDYAQQAFSEEQKHNRLCLVSSADGRDDSVLIHQDVDLYASVLDAGATVDHVFHPGRRGWVQAVRGEIEANGEQLSAGDGLALQDVESLSVAGVSAAEFLLFDMR